MACVCVGDGWTAAKFEELRTLLKTSTVDDLVKLKKVVQVTREHFETPTADSVRSLRKWSRWAP